MKIADDLDMDWAKPLILGLLRGGESHGYSLVHRIKELSGGEVEWTDGMVYPLLHRLEAEGLIHARWGESNTGRQRKYYSIPPKAPPVSEDDRRQWMTVNTVMTHVWESRTV
jgi:PadR family transcriptional regulator PadR